MIYKYLALVKDLLEVEVQVVLVHDLAIGQEANSADDKQLNLGYRRDVVEEISQHLLVYRRFCLFGWIGRGLFKL